MTNLTSRNIKAFTITEILVAIIILSTILVFAIPRYHKAIERAHANEALTQLRTIHTAQQVYKTQTGDYWQVNPAVTGVDSINSALGLNIIANGMTYSCIGLPGSFQCDARRDAPAQTFVIRVDQNPLSSTNPSCVSGACP